MQDFVRLPWQNQSSQSSHVIPTGSSSSGATGLASAYGSVSLDVASEAIESNSAALLRCSMVIYWYLIFLVFQNFEC
jgi:CCR4-NOT transcription complex subunit 1